MKNNKFKFEWVTSDGGPLLLVEERYLSDWRGSDEQSDYERACDVRDWLGLINIGNGQGLILGGDELDATWIPLANGGMLVRWLYSESEEDIINVAKSVSNDVSNENVSMSVRDSSLVLLAACESSKDNIYPRLKINLPSGIYAISTVEFEDKSTSVVCHQFRKTTDLEIKGSK